MLSKSIVMSLTAILLVLSAGPAPGTSDLSSGAYSSGDARQGRPKLIPLTPPGFPRPAPLDGQAAQLDQAQQRIAQLKGSLRDILTSREVIPLSALQRIAAADELRGIAEIEITQQNTPEFRQLKLDSESRVVQAKQQYQQSIVNLLLAVLRFEKIEGCSVSLTGQTIVVKGPDHVTVAGVDVVIPAIDPMTVPEDAVVSRGTAPGTMTVKFGDEPAVTVGQ